MKTIGILLISCASILLADPGASAFCGFYVAKADSKLFNKASQVVLVREKDRTVLTMANDYRGALDEFAVVIPVPTAIERDQINVGDKALIEHLDAYSAPRLVEYHDEDPCIMEERNLMLRAAADLASAPAGAVTEREAALGVQIEAKYTVGEYDIVVLSAKQSDGLETWLKENGYRIPEGAASVLEGYIKQKVHFFVAKVNLAEQSKLGFTFLRPLQIAFESPKFMLPIRLGTVNADGPQDLVIYALTHSGRVETTNYRNVKIPTGMELPVYVKDDFADFYKAMFERQVEEQKMSCVFTEYAWDMAWCDPCAADPLSAQELRKLGVFWLPSKSVNTGMAQEVYLTRLHVRYDREHFPEDLVFQETGDRENFQGRYVLRYPWEGEARCEFAKKYLAGLPQKHETEAKALSDLTGWDLEKIRRKMNLATNATAPNGVVKWWTNLWK